MTRKVVTVDAVTKALPSSIVEGSDLLTNAAAPTLIEATVAPMLAGVGPAASWTQTANKVASVSAVDVEADVFTSNGHALVNGDAVIPFANVGVIAALRQYLPGGLAIATHYVVNATANTFQVSTTSGGPAVDLTTKATMDPSKWHFESRGAPTIGLTGLSGKCFRFVVRGQFVAEGAINTHWMRPCANKSAPFSTSATIAAGGVGGGAPVWAVVQADVTFDVRSTPSVVGPWVSVGQLSSTADATLVTKAAMDNLMIPASVPTITQVGIVSVGAETVYWANGSVMLAYAL